MALDQSEHLFSATVTMEPTEGLTMLPWELHLFTSVKEDEEEARRLAQGQTVMVFSYYRLLLTHI